MATKQAAKRKTRQSAKDTVAHHKKQAEFLATYAHVGVIKHAAELVGISRRTHYDWLADPAYAEAFAEAEEQAIETLEAEARRRAVDGVDEPIYYKGQLVDTVRKYSDVLLIFLLKGARPERYRERVSIITEDAIDAEIRRLESQLGRTAAPGEASPAP